MLIKETFTGLFSHYTNDDGLIKRLWSEVEECYSDPNRYYHTLEHLDNLLNQLTEIREQLNNWDATLFALYYHDIIYNVQRTDNEEKSAELAEKQLKQITIPSHTIACCRRQILATRSHTKSTDSDVNYFTDADLSILGQPWEIYSVYSKNVRREYSSYPDTVYNPGRKKVLHHFLTMDRIFKTDFFYRGFETPAKQNLLKELELL